MSALREQLMPNHIDYFKTSKNKTLGTEITQQEELFQKRKSLIMLCKRGNGRYTFIFCDSTKYKLM